VVHFDSYASTVAHELIHSLPYLWSDDQMIKEFKKSWHNSADKKDGNGLQIMRCRERRAHVPAVMGGQEYAPWITQASYYHLIDQFLKSPDPAQVLVKGVPGQERKSLGRGPSARLPSPGGERDPTRTVSRQRLGPGPEGRDGDGPGQLSP
jgi:hypothetical protein